MQYRGKDLAPSQEGICVCVPADGSASGDRDSDSSGFGAAGKVQGKVGYNLREKDEKGLTNTP